MLRGVKRTAFEPIRDRALEKTWRGIASISTQHGHGLALRRKSEDSIDVVITPTLSGRRRCSMRRLISNWRRRS